MRNQRKRVGRLRLLVAALVVTSISVAGAAGTASAVPKPKPKPSRGVLEICKAVAGDEKFSGTFGFKVQGVDGVVQVPVDACSMPIQLNPGLATITEVANSGAQLVDIEVHPEERLEPESKDLVNGRVTVEIVAGSRSTQTMVTFINKKKTPPPTNGYVKICKRAGHGVHNGTPFTFTLGSKTVEVQAGECSAKQKVPFGQLTVTEKAVPWTRVSNIDVDPSTAVVGSPNLTAGTVLVDIKADQRVVTEVEFTNKATPPGLVKVCKVPGTGVVPGTPFRFTVANKQVTVPAGSCLPPLSLSAGTVQIIEEPTAGLRVTDIAVAGADGLTSFDLPTGKAQVTVASGQVTEVLFTNSKPYRPGHGCVHPWRWFNKHPKDGKRLAPKGGLTVGGDRLTARQVQAILKKAARGGNLRFELEGELIAALLNQLRRASTPASVQTAVNASQLLLSQSDGAVRNRNGALTSTKLDWWSMVIHNGKPHQAGNLANALGDYNEGQFKGGPRPCGKPKKDKKKGNDDPKHPGGRIGWPI